MEGRRYDSMDGGARATQDAVAENNAGAIVDGIIINHTTLALPLKGREPIFILTNRYYALSGLFISN